MNPHEIRTLDGRWALITGAARRIGACIARTLHAAGAGIVVHYRGSATDADTLVSELNGLRAGSALALQADLLDTPALDRLIGETLAHTGRLDVLVNNASSFYPTPLAEVTGEQWEDLVGSNLKAPLFLSRAALPHLRDARGCIVNIVDIHARRPLRDHVIYGPAKAGLEMLTRSLARDLAPEVRVNGVSPGAILWPEEGLSESAQASIVRQIPLARVGDPADIAGCVLYLVRDAHYVTGQVIAVDGGRSVGW